MGKRCEKATGFLGVDEATVSEDCRVRLPGPVVRLLHERRVGRLWLGIIPQAKALVLCPEDMWNRWVEGLQKQYPNLNTPGGFRAFLSPSRLVTVDGKGRISIQGARRLREYAGLEVGQTVVIVGMLDHLELWADGEFRETIARSEKNLLGAPDGNGPTRGTEPPGGPQGMSGRSPAHVGPPAAGCEPRVPTDARRPPPTSRRRMTSGKGGVNP